MSATAASPALRVDNVRLGILYMMGAVFLFSIQNAIGKWLAQGYPIPMLVFFRSFIALLPSFILVMRAGGPQVMRTTRLGAQFGRAVIWGGSNAASFIGFHYLPIADAVAHLQRCGIAVEAGPMQRFGAKGAGTSVYFRDPDGSLMEFMSYSA